MDVLSVLKGDNQRYFVTQLVPDMVALWPFSIMVYDGISGEYFKDSALTFNSSTFGVVYIVLVTFYVLIALGVGILLEDIGSLIELRLEDIYFDLKSRKRIRFQEYDALNPFLLIESVFKHTTAFITIFIWCNGVRDWLLGCHLDNAMFASKMAARKRFYSNWHNYLKTSFNQGNEPVALRYYRAVLIRFKFEINMSAALLLMLVGHFLLKVRELGFDVTDVFVVWDTWLYLSGIFATVSILIIEAFKMIELLDDVRGQIIKIHQGEK